MSQNTPDKNEAAEERTEDTKRCWLSAQMGQISSGENRLIS